MLGLHLEVPSSLESDRIVVRKYNKDDGEAMLSTFDRNNNREFLREYVDEVETITTPEDAEIEVSRREADWILRTRFVMDIWLRSSGEHIGQLLIEPEKWEVPSFELGWYLNRAEQGKGLATEAAKLSLRFMFEHLNAHKVIVGMRDTNERSYRLAERLGFVREGQLRECDIKNDRRFGRYYYGMLRTEYVSASERCRFLKRGKTGGHR